MCEKKKKKLRALTPNDNKNFLLSNKRAWRISGKRKSHRICYTNSMKHKTIVS